MFGLFVINLDNYKVNDKAYHENKDASYTEQGSTSKLFHLFNKDKGDLKQTACHCNHILTRVKLIKDMTVFTQHIFQQLTNRCFENYYHCYALIKTCLHMPILQKNVNTDPIIFAAFPRQRC